MTQTTQRSAAEAVYVRLRQRICLLDLPPGTPLREQALAKEFGVSRTPVREALTMLRLDGLVARAPGGGSSVSTVDLKDLRDTYSLRVKLAGLVADFMRMPVPEEVLEEVRSIRDEVEEVAAEPDPRRLGEIYNRLHEAMLGTIRNQALAEITDRLFRQTCRIWMQLLPDMSWEEEVQVTLDEIDESLEAMEGSSAAHVADIRSKYMVMLLTRFNEYLTRPLI
ncbi:MAG: GntR family transcriptional regulator [Actinomycetota bacterium]